MVKVAPIRIKQRELEELVLKRMLRESERRKNEKICPILEFLESNTRRVDNQVSKEYE